MQTHRKGGGSAYLLESICFYRKTDKSGVVPNQALWGFCKTSEDFALLNCCIFYMLQIVVKNIKNDFKKYK